MTDGNDGLILAWEAQVEPVENHLHLLFGQADLDSLQVEEFTRLAYELIVRLAQGRVAMCSVPYQRVKEAGRNLLGRRRPARFSASDSASGLKRFLLESNWIGGVLADYTTSETQKYGWFHYFHDHKELCLLMERLDLDLLRLTDFTYDYQGASGVQVRVFPDKHLRCQGSPEETVASYQTADYVLRIEAEIHLPRVYLDLNINYISIDQITELLKAVAAQYNKKVEVSL